MKKKKKKFDLNEEQIDRIIEMAWEDRTPFDAITDQFGLKEQDVIELMRKEMKRSSFNLWRARYREEALNTVKIAEKMWIASNALDNVTLVTTRSPKDKFCTLRRNP